MFNHKSVTITEFNNGGTIRVEKWAENGHTVTDCRPAHAGKPGKSRPARKPHHHRLGLITGVMSQKKTGTSAARCLEKQIIAAGTCPVLDPGRRRLRRHRQNFRVHANVMKSCNNPQRLVSRVGPDAMIHHKGAVCPTMPVGIIFGQMRKRHAVRPAGYRSDQIHRQIMKPARQIGQRHCQRIIECRRKGVGRKNKPCRPSHRNWRTG